MSNQFSASPFLNDRGRVYEERVLEKFASDFEVFGKTIRIAYELRYTWEPHRYDAMELYAALLYARLLEITEATVHLSLRGFSHMGDVSVRMALEVLLKLKAACTEPELAEHFMNQYWLDRKRASKALVTSKNEELRQHEAAYQAALQEAERELDAQDKKRWTIRELAREVDCERLYEVVYRSTSTSVHSSLTSLEEYFELDEAGEVEAIVGGPKAHGVRRQVQAVTEFLLLGMSFVGKRWGLEETSDFARVKNMFRQLSASTELSQEEQEELLTASEEIQRGKSIDGEELLDELRS